MRRQLPFDIRRFLPCLALRGAGWPRALVIVALLWPPSVYAHEGEDHGDQAKAPMVVQSATPRFEAASADAELVGMVRGEVLTLYLSRFATNEPITDAKIEIESGANKTNAEVAGLGSYTARAKWLSAPGKHSLVVGIEAKDLNDLLPATLEISGPAVEQHSHDPGLRDYFAMYRNWIIGLIAVVALIAVVFRLTRRRGGVHAWWLPFVAFVSAAGPSTEGYAHGDEDHSKDAKSASPAAGAKGTALAGGGVSPSRLPDGSVFFPKSTQHLLAIRTVLTQARDNPQTVELKGHVAADPNAGGRAQATIAGRVEPGPNGLPTLGQKVGKGQVLAYLVPVANSIERASSRAQIAELDGSLRIVEQKLRRLEQLEGVVPQKEFDTARAELASLTKRKEAVSAGLFQREAVIAPVSGVVSNSAVVTGQVVEARDVLFEIVDPQRLLVEASAYDPALPVSISGAEGISSTGEPLKLVFLGASGQLREQAIPVLFRIAAPVPPLAITQQVKVLVQLKRKVKGVPLPLAALVKTSAGETVVWVHASAEVFSARKVHAQPLDATTTVITEGLSADERVVVQGAGLLAQVR